MIETISHHLRLFGWPDRGLDRQADPRLRLLSRPTAGAAQSARSFAANGGVVVAIQPRAGFFASMGVKRGSVRVPPRNLSCVQGGAIVTLRTMSHTHAYHVDT